MKLQLTYLLLILGLFLYSCSNSDIDILSKTNKKLQDLKSVQYQTDFKNFNFMTGELGICDTALALFDFSSNDTIIGSKYLFSEESGDMGFDGVSSFYTIKLKKQLIYTSVKTKDDLIGTQYTMFSFQQLRDLLPQMLIDTAIHISRLSDTLINEIDCYRYEIEMHGRLINMNGELVTRENSNHNYEFMIGKEDYLPRRFISYFDKDSPVWIVSYNKLNLSPLIDNSLFSHSLRNPDFNKFTFEEFQLVSMNENILKGNSYLGIKALDWTLPSMVGDSVKLSEIDANLIMLEFWFPYCTGCVAAIPEINEIQEKYKNKGLQVFGIEFTKQDSTNLTDYITKMKIEYPTLYAAKEVASNYGVSSGPSVFLIKDGKFVYARTGFIINELIKEIERNIK